MAPPQVWVQTAAGELARARRVQCVIVFILVHMCHVGYFCKKGHYYMKISAIYIRDMTQSEGLRNKFFLFKLLSPVFMKLLKMFLYSECTHALGYVCFTQNILFLFFLRRKKNKEKELHTLT